MTHTYKWTLFSSCFSPCSFSYHHLCSRFGPWFVDSYSMTRTVLLWLILGYRSQDLKAVPWLMDLFHESPLFMLICYRLCLFNYKYRVVAVVRPQSCLCPLLAIQVIPSQPLSHLSYYALLWITEPLKHWTLAPTAHPLTLSIPRPCKVLTLVAMSV